MAQTRPNTLLIIVNDYNGDKVYFRLNKTTALWKLFRAYEKRTDQQGSVRYMLKGREVSGLETCEILGLEDGDQINCEPYVPHMSQVQRPSSPPCLPRAASNAPPAPLKNDCKGRQDNLPERNIVLSESLCDKSTLSGETEQPAGAAGVSLRLAKLEHNNKALEIRAVAAESKLRMTEGKCQEEIARAKERVLELERNLAEVQRQLCSEVSANRALQKQQSLIIIRPEIKTIVSLLTTSAKSSASFERFSLQSLPSIRRRKENYIMEMRKRLHREANHLDVNAQIKSLSLMDAELVNIEQAIANNKLLVGLDGAPDGAGTTGTLTTDPTGQNAARPRYMYVRKQRNAEGSIFFAVAVPKIGSNIELVGNYSTREEAGQVCIQILQRRIAAIEESPKKEMSRSAVRIVERWRRALQQNQQASENISTTLTTALRNITVPVFMDAWGELRQLVGNRAGARTQRFVALGALVDAIEAELLLWNRKPLQPPLPSFDEFKQQHGLCDISLGSMMADETHNRWCQLSAQVLATCAAELTSQNDKLLEIYREIIAPDEDPSTFAGERIDQLNRMLPEYKAALTRSSSVQKMSCEVTRLQSQAAQAAQHYQSRTGENEEAIKGHLDAISGFVDTLESHPYCEQHPEASIFAAFSAASAMVSSPGMHASAQQVVQAAWSPRKSLPPPLSWTNDAQQRILVCVAPGTAEYKAVAESLNISLVQLVSGSSCGSNLWIGRVQNRQLWEPYCLKREHMRRRSNDGTSSAAAGAGIASSVPVATGAIAERNTEEASDSYQLSSIEELCDIAPYPDPARERLLFHGCSELHPLKLCRTGFDVSYASKRSLYGRGMYFSRTSDYSNAAYSSAFGIDGAPCQLLPASHIERTLSDPTIPATRGFGQHPTSLGEWRVILLASVLTGRQKKFGRTTDRTLKRPPAGYDSVTGGPHAPRSGCPVLSHMVVVYKDDRAYPRYVIAYRPAAVQQRCVVID